MFAVVLDTCVLWPSLQRDFLLSLAIEGLYRPLWSSAILAELEEHEASKLIKRGTPATEAQRRASLLIERMQSAFDDACVQGWEPLDRTYGLPDVDDEHLVAAAVIGGAGAIITDNVRDLPADKIPAGIQVTKPAAFALEQVELAPNVALRAVTEMASRYKSPSRTADDLLTLLESRYGMAEAVELMRGELK